MEGEYREQAWRDSLETDELVEVDRLSNMPPSMAIGYVYVEFKRELNDFRQMHETSQQSRTSKYVRDLISGGAGGLTALGAVTAYILGFTDKVR